MIDQENVEKFAQDHDIPFTNYASLCRAAEIQDLIQREIESVNVNFARVETIKKFFLIERQLTPEDEELTPTMIRCRLWQLGCIRRTVRESSSRLER